MKAALRALAGGKTRHASDWQPPVAAENAARRTASLVAGHQGESAVPTSSAPSTPRAQTAELGGGRPLSDAERAPAESRLGADFSKVRLHAEGAAADATERLGARALARGSDVAFAPGEYTPQRPASQQLLTHELTHVAQQARAGRTATQFEPKKEQAGIGAAPPAEDFIKAPGDWGSEDKHVLFKQDQADLDGGDDMLKQIAERVKEPQNVHVHGYASSEGAGEYNLNLSAHRAAAIKHRLESLLPPGSKVFIFAHGETHHFGGADANRRVGISLMGPIHSAFEGRPGITPRLHLGPQPQDGTYLNTPSFGPTPDLSPTATAAALAKLPQIAPQAPPTPASRSTPRSLMDNAALMAPGSFHDLNTGNPVQHWDASYLKYHGLGIPDTYKLGPIDFGAGALANMEVSSAEKAYHLRNDPTSIEQSNADTGTHLLMSPNLLELGKKKKNKGAGER